MQANFFDVKREQLCALYDVAPEDELLGLDDAKLHCMAYRSVHPDMARGFYISKETIASILAQSDDIDGIRVYGGIKSSGGLVYTASIVATIPGDIAGTHDDYDIPPKGVSIAKVDEPIIGEARPCPIHCGKANELNS